MLTKSNVALIVCYSDEVGYLPENPKFGANNPNPIKTNPNWTEPEIQKPIGITD